MSKVMNDGEFESFLWGLILGLAFAALLTGMVVYYSAYEDGAVDYFNGEIECSKVYTEVVCIDSKGFIL